MCVFDFLFSLPVLVAVAWRFCMTNAQPPKKRRRIEGNNSLSALTDPNPPKERIVSRGAVFSLCAFGFGCECVFVCYVRSSSILDASGGMVVCVCFCLKRALALSLSVRSHCLCLGLSRFLPSFSHLLSLSDLHLSLITFTRKYYFLLCFVLLPLICNNSCILRDATVCVFVVVCSTEKGGLPYLPACLLRVCTVLFFVVELWFFLLAIAQLVLLVCWGCWTFFYY